MPGAKRKSPLTLFSAAAHLLLLFLAFATPAQAGTCDRYDSNMTEKDLAAIRSQMRMHLPARYFDTIGGLALEIVAPDDRDTVFPKAIASRNRIEIPSDYYRVHCLMISFTERLMRIPKDRQFEVFWTLMDQHRDCLGRSSPNLCFRRSIQTEFAGLEPDVPDEQAAEERVRDAFFLVIAHEIAHVLVRKSYSDNVLTYLDHPELSADAIALQAAILAGRDYRRATLALFPASFFDGRGVEFDDRSTDLIVIDRADSSCRSALAFAAGKSWGPEISAARRWAFATPLEQGDGPGSPPLTVEADQIRLQLAGKGAGGLNFEAICKLPSSQIAERGRDYRSLLAQIDRLEASAGSSIIDFASLLRLGTQSDTVRSFLHTVVVYRIINEMMAAFDRKDLAAEKRLFETLRDTESRIDRNSISSDARGMLSMFLGLNAERFAARDSMLDEIVATTTSDLLDAERFLSDTPDGLSPKIARLLLLQGDCAGANRRFTLLRNSSNLTHAAEAKKFSYLEKISPSSCKATVAEMRAKLRSDRGWK